MNDELQKVKGGVSLDLSLERSRAKEDVCHIADLFKIGLRLLFVARNVLNGL